MSKASEIFASSLNRELSGYGSIAKFCRDTGFSRNAVEAWLSGDSSPTVANLDRIAEALDLEPWELIKPEGADQERAVEALGQAAAALTGLSPARAAILAALPALDDAEVHAILGIIEAGRRLRAGEAPRAEKKPRKLKQ